MKPTSDDGNELNATFSVEKPKSTLGFDLIIESRGGAQTNNPSSKPRNSDYHKAFVLLFQRMSMQSMSLENVEIDSREVQQLPRADRSLRLPNFSYPVYLDSTTDFVGLQQAIGRELKSFGNESGRGGNPTKRVRLSLSWPQAETLTKVSIERLLAQPGLLSRAKDLWAESPTSDPSTLEQRVESLRKRASAMAPLAQVLPPPKGSVKVRRSSGRAARFIRDPNVIAWTLLVANDKCEVCEQPAPFKRESGASYLEVHHMRPLAQGGPDTVDNTVECCANCHRRFHCGSDRIIVRKVAINRIARLVDYPEVPDNTETF